MPTRWARPWFAATAACVATGVIISVFTAVNNTNGYFQSGVARGFNTFAFFTVLSNLLVGVAAVALAARPDRSSSAFAVLRLTGVVAIIVTGVVYHVALARLADLESWDLVGDQLVHTVVPVLAVVGWLAFGPRGLTSAQVARWSLVFPVGWLVFTLIRGAAVGFYPYPFVDVSHLGYFKVLVNCVWVSLLYFALAGGATAVDRRLAQGPQLPHPDPRPSPPEG
ncbi:MAG: Pr6Pr family membrane protein [Actinomycetes bacterium]